MKLDFYNRKSSLDLIVSISYYTFLLETNGEFMTATHSHLRILTRQNIRSARRNWAVSATQIATLKTLTQEMQLSVSAGDLILLDGRW